VGIGAGVLMTTVLAIDPGNTYSGWVLIDAVTCRPLRFGMDRNEDLRALLRGDAGVEGRLVPDRVVIEMVASYGMPVGAEVFETCVWVGRFMESVCPTDDLCPPVELVERMQVKVHHCHSARASDANVRQALVDRFAKGEPNHGKGTRARPGWFHGFRADIWQAYGLAVFAADELVPVKEAS
jgi:hypothetical protein